MLGFSCNISLLSLMSLKPNKHYNDFMRAWEIHSMEGLTGGSIILAPALISLPGFCFLPWSKRREQGCSCQRKRLVLKTPCNGNEKQDSCIFYQSIPRKKVIEPSDYWTELQNLKMITKENHCSSHTYTSKNPESIQISS